MTRRRWLEPAELRALVRERDGDACSVCGEIIDFTIPPGKFMGPSLEHVVPLAAGGSRRNLSNLRLAHAFPCNRDKGSVHDGVDYYALHQQQLGIEELRKRAQNGHLRRSWYMDRIAALKREAE